MLFDLNSYMFHVIHNDDDDDDDDDNDDDDDKYGNGD
jgi:hypothetical protein